MNVISFGVGLVFIFDELDDPVEIGVKSIEGLSQSAQNQGGTHTPPPSPSRGASPPHWTLLGPVRREGGTGAELAGTRLVLTSLGGVASG